MNQPRTHALRIAVADDEREMRQFFVELLPHLGHEVVAVAESGSQLVEQCRATAPDLVITDIKMPDMDGLEAVAAVNRQHQVPVILVTAHPEVDFLSGAEMGHVMAYLTKPIKPADLQAAITLAVLRFGHFQQLSKEASTLRQALEDRKLIERAKGAVMKRSGVGEEEAFRRLRKAASDQNRRLVEVAQTVLAAEEVFHGLDRV
jgi:response regulator NasT